VLQGLEQVLRQRLESGFCAGSGAVEGWRVLLEKQQDCADCSNSSSHHAVLLAGQQLKAADLRRLV
jgi:hypothetical protein